MKDFCLNFKLFICFGISLSTFSLSSQMSFDCKDLTQVFKIEHETYLIRDNIPKYANLLNKGHDLFDGHGELQFSWRLEDDLKNEEIWLKDLDYPHSKYGIYSNKKKDSEYIEEQLDEVTKKIQFEKRYPQGFKTFVQIDPLTTLILPDSIRLLKELDSLGHVLKTYTKDTKDKTHAITNYKCLNYDHKGNWTEREKTVSTGNRTFKLITKRTLYYKGEYEVNEYRKIVIDSFQLDDKYIKDPEELKPTKKTEINKKERNEYLLAKRLYQSAGQLFHNKYFNTNHFVYIATSEAEEKETFKTRLFHRVKAKVIDLKTNKFYTGTTSSERWFDHSKKFMEMEKLHEPPAPTDRTQMINGYECQEYIKTNEDGKLERFYMTELLPFINYCDFTFTLPGLIMKSERHIKNFGKTSIVIKIEKATYPFLYFEFMNEAKKIFGLDFSYLISKK